MKTLNADQLWAHCRGRSWVWEYCRTGTARGNALGVQEWLEMDGEYTANLRTCARVAAQIQRAQREFRVGTAFGQFTIA